MSHYLPPYNNFNGKAFNTEHYNHQEQNITLFTGDDIYLKQIGNQLLTGNSILDDILPNTILGGNNTTFSGLPGNVQVQINTLSN